MSDDLIKRSDAIKAVENEDCFAYIECKAEVLYNHINAIPSADRPQGKWKRMKFTDCGSPIDKCSICGHYINGDMEVRKFCPNCGARMKGVDDELVE